MKLTNRDKFILTAVIVVVILILGSVFFIKPKIAEVNSAKATLAEMEQKKVDTEAKLNTLEGLKDQLTELAKNVDELQVNFFDEMQPYETDQHVREILDKAPVKIMSVTMSMPAPEGIAPYLVYPSNVVAYDLKINSYFDGNVPQEVMDAYKGVQREKPAAKNVALTTYAVSYRGDINKLLKALDQIETDEKTIFVTSCSGGALKEGQEGEGQINIYVISVQHMDVEAIDAEE